jgi:hypothetical protein
MKMNRYVNVIVFFMSFVFLTGTSIPQDNRLLNKLDKSNHRNPSKVIFDQVETGIAQGDVALISKYFGSQTYLSLSDGKSGYYSSNQAFYVLEDFFKIYRVASFRFNNINTDEDTPYATGVYNFEFKGKKNAAQVYISLKKAGSGWKITQITIN